MPACVLCPLSASNLSRENDRKAVCKPGFRNLSVPQARTPAAGAPGRSHGWFAQGDCDLLGRLEVPCWLLLGAIHF